jgi:uncharacterized membrane protein
VSDPITKPMTRQLTLILYGALLSSFCLWQILLPDGPKVFLWIVQTVPLLIFLPGLLGDNPRVYIGLCFVLLLYFIKAVEGLFSPARDWLDYVLLTLTVILFIVSMLASRQLQRPAKSVCADSPSSP